MANGLIRGKPLPCVFRDKICGYRKSEKATMMIRCWRCREFKRFLRKMDEGDARLMDEIEKERESSG